MEFLKHTLPNGLQVVAECDGQARSTALGFFVSTGARDEVDAISGVSHFLEHMVFKGTPTRSAEDVNREFDAMGAHYNAFTSEENTVYYAAVLPEYQDASVALLADIMRPSLRDEDFTTEKQVILEEIKMYEDQPPFGADDRVREMFYGGHPLGRSVLGTTASVGGLAVDQMRDYFRRRYSPGNIALVASGQVDFAALVRAAERYCGAWQPVEAPRAVARPQGHLGQQTMHKATATQEYVIQLASGPAATDDARFAAKILGCILGDDSGSRLYWELIDPGRAESVSLGHHDYHGAGLFMTYMSCAPEAVAENLQTIHDLYRQVENEPVAAAELEQAKNKINSRVVLSSERPRGRLFNVGANWTYRQEYRSVADDLAVVDAVTIEQLAAVAKQYRLTQCATLCVGPLENVPAPK
ncbi:MAG: insulinase family protein [Planctomycetes bacterium]|nr:insulinase family protein [Planctomycetota bacterium]